MLVNLERDQEALDSFDRALAIQPDYAKAYYNKAACYALQGEGKLAVENLEQAIKLNPSYRAEVRTDSDFEAILEDKRFRQLFSVNGGNGKSPTAPKVRMKANARN
jgi:tetratricopeptide (TPR) repeat protein